MSFHSLDRSRSRQTLGWRRRARCSSAASRRTSRRAPAWPSSSCQCRLPCRASVVELFRRGGALGTIVSECRAECGDSACRAWPFPTPIASPLPSPPPLPPAAPTAQVGPLLPTPIQPSPPPLQSRSLPRRVQGGTRSYSTRLYRRVVDRAGVGGDNARVQHEARLPSEAARADRPER